MTDDELDLVETDALLDALHRRLGPHGALVYASLQDRAPGDRERRYRTRGCLISCWALAMYLVDRIRLAIQRNDDAAESKPDDRS